MCASAPKATHSIAYPGAAARVCRREHIEWRLSAGRVPVDEELLVPLCCCTYVRALRTATPMILCDERLLRRCWIRREYRGVDLADHAIDGPCGAGPVRPADTGTGLSQRRWNEVFAWAC